jgi:hypothetical protein
MKMVYVCIFLLHTATPKYCCSHCNSLWLSDWFFSYFITLLQLYRLCSANVSINVNVGLDGKFMEVATFFSIFLKWLRKTTKCFNQVKWTVGPDLNLGYSEYGNCWSMKFGIMVMCNLFIYFYVLQLSITALCPPYKCNICH